MATNGLVLELKSPISPVKLFKANVLDGHKVLPLAMPDVVASSAIIQGDGGVGSIRQIKFTDAVPYGSITERFKLLHKHNFVVKLALVEGPGLGDKLEWSTCFITVWPVAPAGPYKNIKSIEFVEEVADSAPAAEGAGLGDEPPPAAAEGSLYGIVHEYKTLSRVDFIGEEFDKYWKGFNEGMSGMFRAVEAYLLANPDCV